MLNISKEPLNNKVDLDRYKAYQTVNRIRSYKQFNFYLLLFGLLSVITLFLPWTQNVSGKGYITALSPEQRPQSIQSPIPGRIEKWYVKEGDFVKKGDTILFISEIKTAYQDPKLLDRTQEQRLAKKESVKAYSQKLNSLENQIRALKKERVLKLDLAVNKIGQYKLKIQNDSIALVATKIDFEILEKQFSRTQTLVKEGLKSTLDLEQKKLKLQEKRAKYYAQQNKLDLAKNEFINAKIERNRIEASYADKISKARSNFFTAKTNQYEAEIELSKIDNKFSNYKIRNQMSFITAPQDGYINKALKSGVGETIKEGDKIVQIMPAQYDIGVETYVSPIDLPLLHLNESVRIQFDGWPGASFGTFSGKIVAIENFISPNGKFRVLIAPDKGQIEWPKKLSIGSGANTIALLNDVPIWYELWRKLNGFPPDYYQTYVKNSAKSKK